jgi:DNA-binding transcriptional ArsR family regulator
METTTISPITEEQLDAVFGALADRTRRAILARLAEGEASVNELRAPFAVSQPAISQHLKVLQQTGLVNQRREGARRLYSVRADGLADLQTFLADVLPARLERLKQVAEAEERSRGARAAERN